MLDTDLTIKSQVALRPSALFGRDQRRRAIKLDPGRSPTSPPQIGRLLSNILRSKQPGLDTRNRKSVHGGS